MTPLSRKARLAGALYLLTSLVGVVRLIWIPSALIDSGNAAATAASLRAHEMLFRLGMVSQLAGAALWLLVVLVLYRLLEGVDERLAKLMVILGGFMVVPLFFVNAANDAAALMLVRGGDFLSAFTQPQRESLALLFLRIHHFVDLANQVFWGLWLIPFGLLVYRSRFLPRLLGVWLIAACFGYLAASCAGFVVPQWEGRVANYAQPLMVGELIMMLWLIIFGARERGLPGGD